MQKNAAAQELGRMGRGKPKKISKEESIRRSQSLAKARAMRWVKKDERTTERDGEV